MQPQYPYYGGGAPPPPPGPPPGPHPPLRYPASQHHPSPPPPPPHHHHHQAGPPPGPAPPGPPGPPPRGYIPPHAPHRHPPPPHRAHPPYGYTPRPAYAHASMSGQARLRRPGIGMGAPAPGLRVIPRGGPPPPPLANVTVYVGKIPTDVDDTLVKKLLDQCGRVMKWNRVKDPAKDTPKAFGFCQFADPAGALRALRLLHDIEIDESKLVVKVDKKTRAQLDAYIESQKNPVTKALNMESDDKTAQGDDVKAVVIRRMIEDRHRPAPAEEPLAAPAASPGASEAADAPEVSTAADSGVSSDIPDEIRSQVHDFLNRYVPAKDEKPPGPGVAPVATKPELQDPPPPPPQPQSPLQPQAEPQPQPQPHIPHPTRDRERGHRDSRDHRDRPRDRERDPRGSRSRRSRTRSRSHGRSSRRRSGRRSRSRSRENHRHRRSRGRRGRSRSSSRESSRDRYDKRSRRYRRRSRSPSRDRIEFGPSASESIEEGQLPETGSTHRERSHDDGMSTITTATTTSMKKLGFVMKKSSRSKSAAVQPQLEAFAGPSLDSSVNQLYSSKKETASVRRTAEEVEQLLPKDRDALFAYEIDWKLIRKFLLLERKLRPWLSERVQALMGVADNDLVTFVIELLEKQGSPQTLLESMLPILADDASTFVFNLWTHLVREMLAV